MSSSEGVLRPLSAHAIFLRYVIFAVIAGLSNVVVQEAVIRIYPPGPLFVSILAGTGAGFLIKYLLEKKWVFFDEYNGSMAEARKITYYGLFGVGTTLLFWSIEFGLFYIFKTDFAKYVGAIIGLSIGNILKYQLDKHFVFSKGLR